MTTNRRFKTQARELWREVTKTGELSSSEATAAIAAAIAAAWDAGWDAAEISRGERGRIAFRAHLRGDDLQPIGEPLNRGGGQ